MNVVYFSEDLHVMINAPLDNQEPKPSVRWGITDDFRSNNVHVTLYSMYDFTLYDGVNKYDFETKDKWHNVPKNVDICKNDLIINHMSIDKEKFNKCEEFIKDLRINKPEDIIKAIEQGFLIEKSKNCCRIVTEVSGNNTKLKYRLKKEYSKDYDNFPTSFFLENRKAFDNYEDALNYSKGLLVEHKIALEQNHYIDIENYKLWILGRISKKNYDACKFLLDTTHYNKGFSLRFYQNEVLLRNGTRDFWQCIFKDE